MKLYEVTYEYDNLDEFNEHYGKMCKEGFTFISSYYPYGQNIIRAKYINERYHLK